MIVLIGAVARSASHSATSASSTPISDIGVIIAAVVAIITLAVGLLSLRGYIRNIGVKAQLEAKDEIIKTNEQTIDALTHRVGVLEESFKNVVADNTMLHGEVGKFRAELVEAKARYEELERLSERYSAPEAVRRLEQVLANRSELFDKMAEALARIEAKLA